MKGIEFRKCTGESVGFIPDEGSGKACCQSQKTTGTVKISKANIEANGDDGEDIELVIKNEDNSDFNPGFKRAIDKFNYTIDNNTTVRTTQEFYPFSEIFGFADGFDRILNLVNTEISFERNDVSKYENAIFGDTGTDIIMDSIQTGILDFVFIFQEVIPHPELKKVLDQRMRMTTEHRDEDNENKLLPPIPLNISFLARCCEKKIIEGGAEFGFSFTKFQLPRYIIIGIKGLPVIKGNNVVDNTTSQNAVDKNYGLFRHCDISSITIDIDGKEYPNKPQNAEFEKNKFSMFYSGFRNVCQALGGECAMTEKEYKELYTIFAIDTSDQMEKTIGSVVNMSINIKRNEDPTENTNPRNPKRFAVYCLILNEVMYAFYSAQHEVKRIRGGVTVNKA